MVLHMLKYLELNFPVLSDFGKIRNDAIIRSIIHFWGLLGSEWSKMVEYVANLGCDLLCGNLPLFWGD